MMGMSPMHEQRVTAPLAAPKISSQGFEFWRFKQLSVMLAVAPESGEAAMSGSLVSKLRFAAWSETLMRARCWRAEAEAERRFATVPGSRL